MKRCVIFLMSLSGVLFAGSPQGVPVETTTIVGTSGVQVLAANADRGYLIVQNNGTGNCFIKFTGAITGSEGLIIGSGQNFEPTTAFIKKSLNMRCASAGSSIVTLETNY